MRNLCLFALLMASGWIASIQAQPAIPDSTYRNDGTTVLQGEAPIADAETFNAASFCSAYAKAGRPRFVVLWNRELSDQLDQDGATRTTVESAAVTTRQYGPNGHLEGLLGGARITTETVRSSPAVRSGPLENVDTKVRSDFLDTLMAAGVRLVDRNVTMRSVAARERQGVDHDAQRVEIQALQQHAQYLIEVLRTPDPAAVDGWAISVTVKSLVDDSVIATAYLDGNPTLSGPAKYVADPAGGYRAVMPNRGVGRSAAEQVLISLNRIWQR